MAIWFTSDHHFNHKNIIAYCERPFDSVTEMNEELVKAWNSSVLPEDHVFYLGDFSMTRASMEEFAPRLNGTKILIAGNHDTCHPCNNGGRLGQLSVYKKYFAEVYEQLEWNGHLLHHMPYHDDYDNRYPEHRPFDQGKILIHGHVHCRWLTNGRQINVGVDQWDYTPVNEAQLLKLIESVKNEEYV